MSDAELPTISVIVPTSNSGRFLPLCLEAIRMQGYPPEKIEVLVIDGGSTDATASIAHRQAVGWPAAFLPGRGLLEGYQTSCERAAHCHSDAPIASPC